MPFLSLPLKRGSFCSLKSVFIRLGSSLWTFPLNVQLHGCGLGGAVWETAAAEGGKIGVGVKQGCSRRGWMQISVARCGMAFLFLLANFHPTDSRSPQGLQSGKEEAEMVLQAPDACSTGWESGNQGNSEASLEPSQGRGSLWKRACLTVGHSLPLQAGPRNDLCFELCRFVLSIWDERSTWGCHPPPPTSAPSPWWAEEERIIKKRACPLPLMTNYSEPKQQPCWRKVWWTIHHTPK